LGQIEESIYDWKIVYHGYTDYTDVHGVAFRDLIVARKGLGVVQR
jgi:hypothetical protein